MMITAYEMNIALLLLPSSSPTPVLQMIQKATWQRTRFDDEFSDGQTEYTIQTLERNTSGPYISGSNNLPVNR